MRMRIPLAAHVENVCFWQYTTDRSCTALIICGLPHHHGFMGGGIAGRAVFSMVTPIGVSVPIHKSDQCWIEFVNKPLNPIHPEGLETFNGRPPDGCPPGS